MPWKSSKNGFSHCIQVDIKYVFNNMKYDNDVIISRLSLTQTIRLLWQAWSEKYDINKVVAKCMYEDCKIEKFLQINSW